MLRCIPLDVNRNQPAWALSGSRRKRSRSAAWDAGTQCCAKPPSAPDAGHVFKNRPESSEAGACTCPYSSYYWQHPPPSTRSQKTRMGSHQKSAPSASPAHDASLSVFLGLQVCSAHLFSAATASGTADQGSVYLVPHPTPSWPSPSPHLSSHHADFHPNWSWTGPGTVLN